MEPVSHSHNQNQEVKMLLAQFVVLMCLKDLVELLYINNTQSIILYTHKWHVLEVGEVSTNVSLMTLNRISSSMSMYMSCFPSSASYSQTQSCSSLSLNTRDV